MFERDGRIKQTRIFIVHPHKTSKLCKHSFIVTKSFRVLAYPQKKKNKKMHIFILQHVERRMLEGLMGQAVEMLAKANISAEQHNISPDCPSI